MPDVVATLRTWRSVLTQPHVLGVFVATGAGRVARASAPLAVVLVVAASTGSYAWAGAAAGVLTLADAATAPAKGRLADRYGRTLGLLPGVLGHAAALVALAAPVASGRAWTLGCAAVAGACAPPVSGSVKSLLPALVGDGSRLRAAYVLESSVQQLLFFAGPVYVAAASAAFSARAALAGAAACTVAGVVAFVVLTRRVLAGGGRPRLDERRPRAGALGVPAVRVLTFVTLLQSIAFGANGVAVAATAGSAGAPNVAGLVLAFGPVGGLVGGLLIAPGGGRRAPARLVRMLVIAAACYAPMVVLPLPAVAACLFGAGLVVTPLAATVYLLLSEAAPVAVRTEAFAWLSTAVATGSAIGSAVAGQVADQIGARPALLVAGCAVLAAAVAGAVGRGVLGLVGNGSGRNT